MAGASINIYWDSEEACTKGDLAKAEVEVQVSSYSSHRQDSSLRWSQTITVEDLERLESLSDCDWRHYETEEGGVSVLPLDSDRIATNPDNLCAEIAEALANASVFDC